MKQTIPYVKSADPQDHALKTGHDEIEPIVSVVIPTLNREAGLLEAIASVLAQNIATEILVIDDGSTDGTTELDFAAIHPSIRLLRHDCNRGGSRARNTGIDAARAPLVAFLDSDDRWLPGKLKQQLAQIADLPPGSSFIMAANVYCDRGGDLTPHNRRPPGQDEPASSYLMLSGQAMQTSTLLMPTSLAREIRFRPDLRRHQDWDFLLRTLRHGASLLYDDTPLSVYNLQLDPNRVTRQKRRIGATVEWLRLARDLVPARTMQTYFAVNVVGKDMFADFGSIVRGLLWLAWLEPRGVPAMLRALFGRLVKRGDASAE